MPKLLNDAGLALLMDFEQGPGGGPALKSYTCPAGKLTIGYGHVIKPYEQFDTISPARALTLLKQDAILATAAVEAKVKVPVNDNQFAALTCFTFNVGILNFATSTLLRKLNEGQYDAVPHELLRWVYANGRELNGLKRRRQAEVDLWNKAA